MDLLILGGTSFLGPELVDAARARKWNITLFNRGKTNPGRFPDLTTITGDRDPAKGEGFKNLEKAIADGKKWDAVIDTSGYVRPQVKASAALLKKAARQYVFISTISVYAQPMKSGGDETAPLEQTVTPDSDKVGQLYGALKALCEQAVTSEFGDRATNIRPGLIVGPGDPTDRFTYWPVRVGHGGKVLIPGPKDPWKAYVSFVDVRDCAEFAVKCVADGHGGTFNCTGPEGLLTFDEMVAGCKAVVSDPVEFVPVDEKWLMDNNVAPWMGLPLWIPAEMGDGMGTVSRAKAVAAGCKFRPLAETARDTLAWWRGKNPGPYAWGEKKAGDRPQQRGGSPGLTLAREAELLKAYAARTSPAGGPAGAPASPTAPAETAKS
jgi:2'-hydroxyisoflavone reductase